MGSPQTRRVALDELRHQRRDLGDADGEIASKCRAGQERQAPQRLPAHQRGCSPCNDHQSWATSLEVIDASLGASRWLLDTSVFHHIARAPAAGVRWGSLATLVAAGIAAAAFGAFTFARRDLAGC
jgi:hypothetical protein